MHFSPLAALVKIILLSQLLNFGRTINVKFFPCDADVNSTAVDCSDRPLKSIPHIKANTVLLVNLSLTKILYLGSDAFTGVPNLETLKLMGNCQPGRLRAPENPTCQMKIHPDAFMSLQNLTSVYLSGNSLTSIPRFPESLKVLDLQNNCIVRITAPLNTPNLEALFLSKNCFYANPCDQSYYINETVLTQLPKLKNLTLGYNNLTAVPKGLPSSLEELDLKENTIQEVPPEAFANLTALVKLNIEWNCQRCDHAARPCFPCPGNKSLHLHPKSFYAQTSSITYLSLRGNSLKSFPEGLFRPLTNLKRLDLSDNFLAHAIQNATFFGELTSLTWISLIYNYEPLKTFPKLVLSPSVGNISGLQYLLLSGNFFHSVTEDSFKVLSKLQNLTKLELRMNFINECNLMSFKQLPSLTDVDLSQNMLSFLPSCATPSSTTVRKDNLQNQNSHTEAFQDHHPLIIDRETMSSSDSLESTQSDNLETIEDNECEIPPPWYFKDKFCRHERTFDLSQNDILRLHKKVFVGLENCTCLDLSYNYMSQTLRGGVFSSMKYLVFLNMSYNRLDLYHDNAFIELKSTLKVLDVSNNDFHFKMRGMGHRFEFLHNLTNLKVLSLANNGIGMRIDQRLVSPSLEYLYFNGNNLDIMWGSDNNRYTHFFQNLTALKYLDISNNHLKSLVPEVLCNFPISMKVLTISNNLLKYFPWRNISTLSNLCHLDLSRNYLTDLLDEAIVFGDKFSLLDLSHNYLDGIPENFFSGAKSLRYLYLSHNQIKELNHQHLPAPFSGSVLQKLTLHDNPFKCDCDTSWFADFLRTTSVKIPHLTTHVRCGFPESQQGERVLSMDQHSCQDIYGSLAFLISSFFAVVFTVLPLLQHLYGWDVWYCLQVLWAGHKGYSQLAGRDSCHHFDAFVVFDTKNQPVSDWVYNELIVNLENCGHRTFSLCLEERDWIPGLSCIDNLHNAVHSSVKTVFVLSRGADGSEMVNGVIRQAFFMVQQRLLDEKVDAAVLVLLDETFPKLKYLQLRKRLCRKSVLSWPRNPRAQPMFWNRMRMALSSDNLKLYDNKMSESFI